MNLHRLNNFGLQIANKWGTDETFKLYFICYSFTAIHFAYFCFFTTLGILPLEAYGMFSTGFYLLLGLLEVKKRRFVRIFLITTAEVVFFSIFCTLMIGWDYGFMIYLLTMVPIIFYLFTSSNVAHAHRISGCLTLFIILSFVLAKWLIAPGTPLYAPRISQTGIKAVYTINCMISFSIQALFAAIHTAEIQQFKSNLESEKDVLDAIASKDPLTGLLNRRAMEPHLNQAKATAETKGTLFSLILCDIDDFKKVNDIHGHALGDLVLKTVANTFLSNLRDSDYACRWGGEEFLMLIPGRIDIASGVAERLRSQIEALTFQDDMETFSVTMTFGVTEYETGYRMEKLIKIADDNLYKGKANGKNQVVCS